MRSGLDGWADLHAEVALDAGVPGVVIRRVQIGKLLVGHACAPAEEGCRVRADRMPQLPGAALDDLLADHRNVQSSLHDFDDSLDIEMPCAAGNIDPAQYQRLAQTEKGDAFDDALPDDGFLYIGDD